MAIPRHIEAQIYYLTTDEGGRKTPVNSGYRGQFHYDGIDVDAPQEFPDGLQAKLGEEVRAYLAFLTPEISLPKMHVGKKFLVREGARTVGRGVVTQVFSED